MNFVIPGKVKTLSYILMAIGVIALIWGYIQGGGEGGDHHQRWWSNMVVDGFFFLAIGLGAMFFYALQYAAEVGWSSQIKRLFEAMFSYVPVGLVLMMIIVIAGQFGIHHSWHWMDSSVYEQGTDTYDAIIANKKPYFGWFFWVRQVAYLAVFIFFARFFRKQSLLEDQVGGTEIHYKLFRRGALFLVFFAVFSSTMAWDWLMSIDTHWFSTMYGWYVFSGMWVTCMIFATLLTLWLRHKGHLPHINDSHVHDLTKWMFAISMLWSYLWFCQFMLIWYSNIPEEVQYFTTRFFGEHGGSSPYLVPFMLMFFINFALPFYMLIARDAKRNPTFIIGVGIIIFISHFVDVYLLVIPGTIHMHDFHGFQWWEWGTFAGFFGLFLMFTMRALSKAPLVPVNHPFLDESKHHQI
ncbi:MAG: quinol:cytochrome C oxidoreductase [Flavobacteriales bacterium]|nr:quinol:cytochrome C oxidoreductase [Flavobacteriales bacterium]